MCGSVNEKRVSAGSARTEPDAGNNSPPSATQKMSIIVGFRVPENQCDTAELTTNATILTASRFLVLARARHRGLLPRLVLAGRPGLLRGEYPFPLGERARGRQSVGHAPVLRRDHSRLQRPI